MSHNQNIENLINFSFTASTNFTKGKDGKNDEKIWSIQPTYQKQQNFRFFWECDLSHEKSGMSFEYLTEGEIKMMSIWFLYRMHL